jgi:regulator of replication initiation timing
MARAGDEMRGDEGAAGDGREEFVMAKTGRTIDLEPIDRLEEKVRKLVSVVERLRADQARAVEENARLSHELDGLRARVAEAEGTTAEMHVLREERDLIRTRVAEMLEQLEGLNV